MKESLPQEASRALGAALRYLAARDRTRYEVESYLRKKGFSDQVAREALERLGRWGYLDDRRVALNWARTKMQTALWGRARVSAALQRRGVERETIQEILFVLDQEFPDADLALRAARKYIRSHPRAGAALGRRLAAYLSRRGFAPEIITRLIFDEIGPDLKREHLDRENLFPKKVQGDSC